MAHIISAKIESLAGRPEVLDIKFHRDINIFYGPNGAGKSSLLKVLHAAMIGETKSLVSVAFRYAEVAIYSVDYNKVFTYTLDRRKTLSTGLLTPSNQEQEQWTITPPRPESSSNRKIHWRNSYLPISRLHELHPSLLHRVPTEDLSESSLDAMFAHNLNYQWQEYSVKISAEIQKAQADGLAAFVKAALSTGRKPTSSNASCSYEAINSFLKRQGAGVDRLLISEKHFETKLKKNSAFRQIAADITVVEENIEKSQKPRADLENLLNRLFNGRKTIKIDREIKITDSEDNTIPIPTLSSGEKHLLKLFISNFLAAESSLIIDEPELSLHISWQRILITSLKQLNPHSQIIAATHSPEVLADIPDENIFKI